MEKNELKELLKESTEKVLFELGKILDKNSSLYNELIILWKRHDDIEREIRLGTIGFEEASRENNKVIDSILKLIDKIEKPNENNNSNTINKKEIVIKDAIEWLENILVGQNRITEKQEYEKISGEVIFYFSKWNISHVKIEKNGGFVIVEDFELKVSLLNDEYSPLELYRHYTIKKNIVGNFRDIGNVVAKEMEGENSCNISFTATNYKRCFYVDLFKIYEKQDDKSKGDIEQFDKYENQFNLYISNLEIAIKIKNAFDYLAIHFGRKEDAF